MVPLLGWTFSVGRAAAVAARTLIMVGTKNCILSDVFFVVEDISKWIEMPRSTGWKSIQGCWSDGIETVRECLPSPQEPGVNRLILGEK